jgi:hypothetical protein
VWRMPRNGIVEVRLDSAYHVWQFDVPPTPYSVDGSFVGYLCPDLRASLTDCLNVVHDAAVEAQAMSPAEEAALPLVQTLRFSVPGLRPSIYRLRASRLDAFGHRMFAPALFAPFQLGNLLIE